MRSMRTKILVISLLVVIAITVSSVAIGSQIVATPAPDEVQSFLLSGSVFLGLGVVVVFLVAGGIASCLEKISSQRRQASAAVDARNVFLKAMSHAMNAPLCTIIGLSELELEQSGRQMSRELRECMEKIHSSGLGLLDLVNDVLDLSLIESGRMKLRENEYDVPALIGKVAASHAASLAGSPVRLRLNIPETLPARLSGDGRRLGQMLNHLLSCACRTTREGSVVLEARWELEGKTAWLTFIITDTDAGIRDSEADALFTCSDENSATRGSGGGMELLIARELARFMGGDIVVKNTYGVGSVFCARVRQRYVQDAPIGKTVAERLNRGTVALREHSTAQLDRTPIPYARVLVVDDVTANLEVVRGMLRPYGVMVDCVSSGMEAVSRVRRERVRYHAIFMDYMMPGMDGIEALRVIRNDIDSDYARQVPVIAMTAHTINGSEEMFIKNGFQSVLYKPVDIVKLDAVLDDWVRDRDYEKRLAEEAVDTTPTGNTVRVLGGGARPVPGGVCDDRGEAYAPVASATGFRGNGFVAGEDGMESETEASLRQFFLTSHLDGLNCDKALKRFSTAKGYFKSLQSYAFHVPLLLDNLAAPDSGKLKRYIVAIHGIKGASRGICADVLADEAEVMERAARRGDFDWVSKHNDAFIANMEKFIHCIGAVIRQAEERKPRRSGPDTTLLARLRGAAEDLNVEEADRAMEALEEYSYDSLPELISWLRERVDQSKFGEIRERLSLYN